MQFRHPVLKRPYKKNMTLRVVVARHKIVAAFLSGTLSSMFILFVLSVLFPLPALKPYSMLIEDRTGKFLHAFLAEDDAWRLKTSPDEIPERLKQILIEKEDRYFYYHPGINPFPSVAQPSRTSQQEGGFQALPLLPCRLPECWSAGIERTSAR